jgi:predicted phospho-2-dehydro-3-deoxyheptonate aldolase
MFGKNIRMERIIDRETGNAVIVPVDHGISIGPINGLIDMKSTVNAVSEGGATAVLMQKGLVPYGHRTTGNDVGLILHLSASTNLGSTSDSKVLVATVEEAIKLGADAVSIHVNLGAESEPQMLSDFGEVSRKCTAWGMPLLVMAYARGPTVKDQFDPDTVAHCARVGMELGADLIKVSYTGDVDSFRNVVKGALAPVLIAGGPKISSDMDVLNMVYDSIEAGGSGVSIGRNIFQHKDPKAMTKAISGIVLKGMTVEEASKLLK